MERFTMEEYDRIKKVLKDNKIDSRKLNQYIFCKGLRYKVHKQEIIATDDEIISCVNQEMNWEDLPKVDGNREPSVKEIIDE